ncbi:hypothetical protein ACHAWF_008642 [Thalassiosira exigua]
MADGNANGDISPDFELCSVESLVAVPMKFIFGKTQTGKNFTFSKSEVSTLLRVSMLSSELDAIIALVYDALDRSQKCKMYRRQIEESNKEPSSNASVLLRALLPILDVHAETSETALSHATCETGIGWILEELEAHASDLGKFAEQNHTMADQLDGYMAPGQNTLSIEKRAIAEVEEAIVERIQNLSALATGMSLRCTDQRSPSNTYDTEKSMNDLCESLFPRQHSDNNNRQSGQFSESQIFAAEALQIMHSSSRGK